MRRVRPGPERDAAIERMRERWAADEAALKRAPFPIIGLAPPFPSPAMLGSYEAVNGHVASVGLRYGLPGPSPGPQVTVGTTPAAADHGARPVADLLRDLLTEQASEGQSPPPGHGDPEAAEVFLDGVPMPTRLLSHGQAWAAVAEPTVDDVALLVTVRARNWPPSGLGLTRVDDLEPFFAGRRERVESALARAGSVPGPEEWDLPAADGLAGHRALADMMIAITRASTTAAEPTRESALPRDYAQRWEIATRAQMHLAGLRRDDAEDAIHSVINHLCQLVQSANWFADSELAHRATAETLDHVAYGRTVPSVQAQRAWSRYWQLHGQDPPAFAALSSAKESWLAAWQRWAERS
jgi:hypothetical protein